MPTEYLFVWGWHVLHGLHTNWHPQISWWHMPLLPVARWGWPMSEILDCPVVVGWSSLPILTKGNCLIMKPDNFWNLKISHRAMVPGLNLLLFFSFPFSFTSANFCLSLTFSSFNCGTLHCLPVFVSHIYLFYDVLYYTNHLAVLHYLTLLCYHSRWLQLCKLKLGERQSLRKFQIMLCCHDALMSDTFITPLILISSHTSFVKSTMVSNNHACSVRDVSDDFPSDPNTPNALPFGSYQRVLLSSLPYEEEDPMTLPLSGHMEGGSSLPYEGGRPNDPPLQAITT